MKRLPDRFSPWPILILPALLSALAGAGPVRADVRFTLTDLGSLGGSSSSANAINAAGQVVGTASLANGDQRAFLWQAGSMQAIGTLGGTFSRAYGINDAGQVVGDSSFSGDGLRHGFIWSRATGPRDLGKLTDTGLGSIGYGISASGQVAGEAVIGTFNDPPPRAFLWQFGTMQDLGTLGGRYATAFGLNDAGQVVGRMSPDFNTQHAFLWQAGRMQDLGTLGGSASAARAVNSSGWVVGDASTTFDAASHAFLWQGGAMRDLGTLGGASSIANGINGLGQVVGHSMTAALGQHAFLRGAQGGMVDLTPLVGGPPITDAAGVNDLGQIAATATLGGANRAVLLTPTGTLTWRGGGAGGSFGDAAKWELGFTPNRFLDVVIAPAGAESVVAGADAVVKSLVVGGAAGASGRPELLLALGATLHATDGATVQATGTLAGDGRIDGTLNNLGTLRAGNLAVTGRFDNAGRVIGDGVLTANLNNAAAGTVQSSGGEVLRLVGAAHLNQGLIDISGGATQQYTGRLVNAAGGRVLLDNAVLRLDDGLGNAGQVLVSFGGATVHGEVTTQAGGKVILSGNSDTTFVDAIDVQAGGELRVSAGSTAVFFGQVHQRGGAVFAGTGAKFYEGGLSIGDSPGLGRDAGDVSFGSGNTYVEEIGGLAAGTQFDQYLVAGTLGFGGTLKVVWWGSFQGEAGQRFDLFDWGHETGRFAAIDLAGAPLAAGLRWDTSKLYSTGEIGISAVPEPSGWTLMLAGLAVIGGAIGRRRGSGRFAARAMV